MIPLYRSNRTSVAGEEDGQTMAEYGVVLSVITITTVAIFIALADSVLAVVERAAELLPG